MRFIFSFCFMVFLIYAQSSQAVGLSNESLVATTIYKPSKTLVMKTLDKMRVHYRVDREGDLVYTMNKKGWTGYIIFSYTAEDEGLWNVQVRTQFATKTSDYKKLLKYANDWNGSQKVPKIAMKTINKMVLSLNYPVQFGFNPKEFEHNVFNVFNRTAEKIGSEINLMRR